MKRISLIIVFVLLAASASAQDSLKIISPNGGEKFLTGSDTVISWTGIPLTDTVKLEYSTDAGSSWNLITDTATGGRYLWHVPKTVSDSCLVRVVHLFSSKNWVDAITVEGDTPTAIAVDQSGNILKCGGFTGQANFGGITLKSSSNDIYLAKYAPNGTVLWAIRAGGEGDDLAHGIAIDLKGNIFLTGEFGGTIDFGGINLTSIGDPDIFIAKFHPDGSIEWAKRAGGPLDDLGSGIEVDNEGNIFLTGVYSHSASFDNITLISNGYKAFLAKYQPDGTVEWAINASLSQSTGGISLAIDNLQNIILEIIHDSEIVIVKYSQDTNIQWTTRIGGTNGSIRQESNIAVDVLGNIYVTGSFNGTIDFNGIRISTLRYLAFFIAKYHSDGTIEWVHKVEGNDNCLGLDIAVDSINNIYVCGNFDSTVDFQGIILKSWGISNIFVAKYQTNGTFSWVKQAGGNLSDWASGIAVSSDENIYVTGTTDNYDLIDFEGDTIGPCGSYIWKIGDSIQSDTSDSLFSITKPKTLLSLANASGYAGDHKNISLVLKNAPISSVQSLATNFSAKIAYDRTVLYPSSGSIQHGARFDTVTVSGSIGSDSILSNLPFIAMLGESTTSSMNLVDFTWLDGSGQPADFDVETQSGTFYLLGICPAGGTRLYDPDGQVSIAHITPNPSNSNVTIEIQTTESGRTQLAVMNLLGQQVASVFDGELTPGAHSFVFNTNGLSSGSYFLMFATPTVRKMERMDVAK
jgi:hypothetical protein